MAILFLKTSPIGSFVRPSGFTFPTGLTQTSVAGPTTVDYLVVAGGGGGSSGTSASRAGGGGGAGGFRTATGFPISTGTGYAITVGSGGPFTSVGSNSVFSSSSFFHKTTAPSSGLGQLAARLPRKHMGELSGARKPARAALRAGLAETLLASRLDDAREDVHFTASSWKT